MSKFHELAFETKIALAVALSVGLALLNLIIPNALLCGGSFVALGAGGYWLGLELYREIKHPRGQRP